MKWRRVRGWASAAAGISDGLPRTGFQRPTERMGRWFSQGGTTMNRTLSEIAGSGLRAGAALAVVAAWCLALLAWQPDAAGVAWAKGARLRAPRAGSAKSKFNLGRKSSPRGDTRRPEPPKSRSDPKDEPPDRSPPSQPPKSSPKAKLKFKPQVKAPPAPPPGKSKPKPPAPAKPRPRSGSGASQPEKPTPPSPKSNSPKSQPPPKPAKPRPIKTKPTPSPPSSAPSKQPVSSKPGPLTNRPGALHKASSRPWNAAPGARPPGTPQKERVRARLRRRGGRIVADWSPLRPKPGGPYDATTPPLDPAPKPRPKPPWVGPPGDAPGDQEPGNEYPWPNVLHGGLGHIVRPHKPPEGGEEGEPGGDEGEHPPCPVPPYPYYHYPFYPSFYYPSYYVGTYYEWPPAYGGVWVDGYYYPDYYEDHYYYAEPAVRPRAPEVEYPYCPEGTPEDLARALKDIALSWLVEDIELLRRHLSDKWDIEARDDAKDYARTFTRDEFIELTALGFARMETQEFRFTDVELEGDEQALAEARHVYTDERGRRHVAVILYHFVSDYGEWYVDAIAVRRDRG